MKRPRVWFQNTRADGARPVAASDTTCTCGPVSIARVESFTASLESRTAIRFSSARTCPASRHASIPAATASSIPAAAASHAAVARRRGA